jgi:hypothetical protein
MASHSTGDNIRPKRRYKESFNVLKVKKVKYTLVQALKLCTGHTAHSGSRGIVLPFLDYGTRRG